MTYGSTRYRLRNRVPPARSGGLFLPIPVLPGPLFVPEESLMAEIDILVGTVYGSAMLVAETLCDHLQANGHVCQIFDDAALTDIDASRFLLIVTATTGQGDIPPNLQPFASALADRAPYMKGWRYALIAMGDSSYEHFCGAGRTLDALLQELAAEPLVVRLEIDATVEDEPEVAALAWLKTWKNRL